MIMHSCSYRNLIDLYLSVAAQLRIHIRYSCSIAASIVCEACQSLHLILLSTFHLLTFAIPIFF